VRRHATDRLLVAAVAAVGGALLAVVGGRPEAAVLVAPWAVVLVLGLAGSVPGRGSAAVEVSHDRVLAGDEVTVTTAVTGVAGAIRVTCLPSAGFWRPDDADEAGRDAGVREAVVGGAAQVARSLVAAQWGVHDVGRVGLEVTEPYGLFRRSGIVGMPHLVRVHPPPPQLRDLLSPWLVRRVSGAHRSHDAGRGVEYADIRPYATGDTLRDINWRASARSPQMWVSQRHPDRATDVILLLDSFVESGHDVRTVFGLAIEAAVALAESHLAATDRVGLIELGGNIRWVHPGTGKLQLQRLIDELLSAGFYATAVERDLRGVPARALPPRSFVVALTPLLDDRFVEALYVLAGRGQDVAAVECVAPVAARDGELSRVARRFWEAERQMVRDRLAEHGIAVASWRSGDHLAATLTTLARRRRHTVRAMRSR
jgi:uncharacterized protein (DUF58 family)